MDRILHSELVEGCSSGKKCLSTGEDLTVLGGPPSKSVMFNIAGESTFHESTARRSCSVANLGYSFRIPFQFDGTEYGTSELLSIARKRADENTGARVSVSQAIDVLSVPGSETQHGLRKGPRKFYSCKSVRKLLKDGFAAHYDPHQLNTGLSADQMIQFPRSIGFELSLATFRMLEDLLLKISSKTKKPGGGSNEVSAQFPCPSKTGSTVGESVASRSL